MICRCGVDDIDIALRHLTAFFREFHTIDGMDEDALPAADILGQLPDTPCEHCTAPKSTGGL